MAHKILNWRDLENDFCDTLLVGNGASVAVSGGFGWGIAKQEGHILNQITAAAPERVAVSVYDSMQAYCDHAHKALTDIGVKDVRFFHYDSEGAWHNPSSSGPAV